jgi:hypothetical protein
MTPKIAAPVVLALVGVLTASAQVTTQDEIHGVREFTESGTWRVPAGVTRITIELWGGGGGGAGGNSSVSGGGPGGAGGGGGAGAYVRTSLRVTEAQMYTIRVGRGGAGGVGETGSGTQAGEDGEDTVILLNDTVVLGTGGGRGGRAPGRGDYRGGPGGTGGSAEATATGLARAGNPGSPGHDGGFNEWPSTSGGRGGAAVSGTVQPRGSFGGDGGTGRQFGYSDEGKPGGAGSVVLTW